MNEITEFLKDPTFEITIERQSLIELSIALIMVGVIIILAARIIKK